MADAQKNEGRELPVRDSLITLEKSVGNRANLPTFGWESGYRHFYDKETNTTICTPLTLLDVLFQTKDDIDLVKLAQGWHHSEWRSILWEIISQHLKCRDNESWLILADNLIEWEYPGVEPQAPDIAAILNGQFAEPEPEYYHMGPDGPAPAFVIEITSVLTRHEDLYSKPTRYAAVGVREYLIIDMQTPLTEGWQLIGYVLEEDPFYRLIEPDSEGGIVFRNIGLRFVAVGRERIDVYNTQTGEHLLNLTETRRFAKSEAERADAEAARADALEEEVALLRAQLR